MIVYLIVPVVSLLVNVFTMGYALALDRSNPLNRAYAALSLNISLWVLTSSCFHLPMDIGLIEPFSKASSFFWFFTGFLYLHFIYRFLERPRDPLYYGALIASITFVALSLTTDLVIFGFTHYPWGWRFREGPLFPAGSLLAIVIPVLCAWALVARVWKVSEPSRRRQLTPLLAGTVAALLISAVNQFVIPRVPGFENAVRYTASWSVLLSLFVYFTIRRYRFLSPGVSDIAGELFDTTGDGVVIMNSAGEVLHINRSARRMLAVPGDIGGRMRLAEYIRGYQTDASYRLHQTGTLRAEPPRALLLNQSAIRIQSVLTGRILIINDITEITAMQASLRETHELFRLISTNISDIIWLYDLATMKVTYISPSVQKIFGWTPEEVMARDINAYHEGATLDQAFAILEEELRHDAEREPGRTRFIEVRQSASDGSLIDVELTVAFIRDAAGTPVTILGVTRDIRERKRLENELRASLAQLKERNDTIEKDLKTAQIIQRALLPDTLPANDHLNIDFRFLPLEEVGGDYFNIISLAEGGVSLFIGDVSGHGVPAALFLSLVKSASNTLLRKHPYNPALFLEELNTELCENMHSYFITALYGILLFDVVRQRAVMRLACGGHPPPVIWHAREGRAAHVDIKGKLLGILPGVTYSPREVALERGDRLFFYTDGLPETENADHVLLGFERLLEIVGRACSKPLSESLDTIMDEVGRYRGQVRTQDDIILIGIEVR